VKPEGVSSLFFFVFALEYAISKVQEDQVGLTWKGIHQRLACTRDINLLRNNILVQSMKKTATLIDCSKEIGLEINVERIKYMLLFRHQNAAQNQHIKIDNRAFGNVARFRYLGTRFRMKLRGDWDLVMLAPFSSGTFAFTSAVWKIS
jgi:hypothetical protein